MGEEVGDKETGLECLWSRWEIRGCDKGGCSGNGKQGCGMDGLEKDVKWRSGYWLLNNSLRTIRYLQIIAYIAEHSLCVRPCVRRGSHAFSRMKLTEIPR